jgi:hypothetical protein
MINIKQLILNEISDLVSNFLYYDRKNDEMLKIGIIEVSIQKSHITIDEIVNEFEKNLREGLQ